MKEIRYAARTLLASLCLRHDRSRAVRRNEIEVIVLIYSFSFYSLEEETMAEELHMQGQDLTDEQVKQAIAKGNSNLRIVSIQNAPKLTVAAFEGLEANKNLYRLDVSGCSGLFPDDNQDLIVKGIWSAFVRCLPTTASGIVLKLEGCFPVPIRNKPGDSSVPDMAPLLTCWRHKVKRIDMGQFICSGGYCAWKEAGPVQCDYDTSGGATAAFCSNSHCAYQCIACQARFSKSYAYKGMLCRSCGAFWCGGQFCCRGDPRLREFETQEATKQKGTWDSEYFEAHDDYEAGFGDGVYFGALRCRYCSFMRAGNESDEEDY